MTQKITINEDTWKVYPKNSFVDSTILRGPAGADGLGSSNILEKIAFQNLPAYRFVSSMDDGKVQLTGANLSTAPMTLGMNTSFTLNGEATTVITSGEISYAGWSWNVDELIFLGVNGSLTQTPFTDIGYYSLVVGIATSPTSLFVKVETASYLNY